LKTLKLSINSFIDVEMPSIIDGSGLSATFGKTEAHKIHEENMGHLSQMSEEEVLEEQRKLLQTLGT
jgi:hypothetical protein